MLESIYLKQFAIIAEQHISFKPGFNILSGETGAGKSILINALGLQLGDRADSSWVKSPSNRCDIQSFFDTPSSASRAIEKWLINHDYDHENDQCHLRRTITKEGKSKSYINGTPTTLGQTKILGEMLVNIHGQHSHQNLTLTQGQGQLLDQFGDYQNLLIEVKSTFNTWQKLIKTKSQLNHNEGINEQLKLLNYQLEEIEQLNPQIDEFNQLEENQKELSSATETLFKLEKINELTDGEPINLNTLLRQLIHLCSELMQTHPNNAGILEANQLINQAMIYIEEAQHNLSQANQKIESNPEKLLETEQRMQVFYDLARKHQMTPNELPQLYQKLSNKITLLKQTNISLQQIDEEIEKAEKNYFKSAKILSEKRAKTAKKLTKSVILQLKNLGLENALFDIQITSATSPKKQGNDDICFVFSANPGQSLKPLNKIASGGELSRISLAIQVAGTKNIQNKTLIFDEVDSGVGGATAEKVGKLLKQLAQFNQVICITHLAQVASFADHHIKITKTVESDQTHTHFNTLNEKQVIEELARMSGGIDLNEKTLEHAKNIRQNAIQFTQNIKN